MLAGKSIGISGGFANAVTGVNQSIMVISPELGMLKKYGRLPVGFLASQLNEPWDFCRKRLQSLEAQGLVNFYPDEDAAEIRLSAAP